MVNSVFSGGGSCHIMICDAAKYFSQYNGGCLPNQSSVSPNSINKNIQNILNAFEKLFRYTHVDQDYVIDEFDKIIRLLYESKINDSEYNHNLLVQNLVKTLEMLLEDINYYLLDSNSLPQLLLVDVNPILSQILSDPYLVSQDGIATTIYDLRNYLEIFIEKVKTNDFSNDTQIINQFKDLYENVGKDLDKYLDKYAFGDLGELKAEFTLQIYQQLASAILAEKNEDFIDYENIRLIFNSALQGLQRSLLLQKGLEDEIVDLKGQIELLQERNANLLLESTTTANVIAQIRPEIKEYIELYGLPTTGVFDAEKLALIIENMQNE